MVIVDTTSTQNTSSIIQQNSLKKTAKQNIKKKINKKIQALKKEEHCQSVPTLSSIFILSVNVRRI